MRGEARFTQMPDVAWANYVEKKAADTMCLELRLIMDMAKTLPAGFTMMDLINAMSKPITGEPFGIHAYDAELHNHAVTGAVWELVDLGHLAADGKGKGGIVIQQPD